MELPLSKEEYKGLERVAKLEGLTVDQAAQLAILTSMKRWDAELCEQLKEYTDPEVLKVFEKS